MVRKKNVYLDFERYGDMIRMTHCTLLFLCAVSALASACKAEPAGPVPDGGQEEEAVVPVETERNWTDVSFRTPDAHNIDMFYLGNREYKLIADGSDPYIYSARFFTSIPGGRDVLEFEYKSSYSMSTLQIFYALGGSAAENSSKKYGPLKASDSYQTFKADISSFRTAGWGNTGDCLRFDPGSTGRGTLFVRNFIIREKTPEERASGL